MPKIHPYSVEDHAVLAAQLRLAEAGLSGLVRKLECERGRYPVALADRARRLEGEIAGLRERFRAELRKQAPGLPLMGDPYRSV
jgi:hypothetical protein